MSSSGKGGAGDECEGGEGRGGEEEARGWVTVSTGGVGLWGSSRLWACLNCTLHTERIRDQRNPLWSLGKGGNCGRGRFEGTWLLREAPGWKSGCAGLAMFRGPKGSEKQALGEVEWKWSLAQNF